MARKGRSECSGSYEATFLQIILLCRNLAIYQDSIRADRENATDSSEASTTDIWIQKVGTLKYVCWPRERTPSGAVAQLYQLLECRRSLPFKCSVLVPLLGEPFADLEGVGRTAKGDSAAHLARICSGANVPSEIRGSSSGSRSSRVSKSKLRPTRSLSGGAAWIM